MPCCSFWFSPGEDMSRVTMVRTCLVAPASYIVHIVAPCFVAQRTPFFLHTVLHTMWPFAHIWVSFSLDTIILQDSFSSGESPALLCSSHINYFLCLHFIFERWMLHVTALHNTYVLWPWKKFQEHPWKYPCKYFPHRTHSAPPLRTLRCNNYRGTMMLVDPGWEITCQSWREGSPGQSTVTSLWWCNICKHTKSCQYHNIIWCDSVTTQPLELKLACDQILDLTPGERMSSVSGWTQSIGP